MTPNEIKTARTGLGWTQERLAQEAGVHLKTVAYWERSKAEDVKHSPNGAVPRIAQAFKRHGVQIDKGADYRQELQQAAADLAPMDALRLLIEARRLTGQPEQRKT